MEDRPNSLDIDGPARLGAVEVDQVDPGGSFRLPVCGHRRGVVAENRLLVVIPLPEADAAPSPQVDGRDHLHDLHQSCHGPFNDPHSSRRAGGSQGGAPLRSRRPVRDGVSARVARVRGVENSGDRNPRTAIVSEPREVGVHRQPDLLALLGVELAGHQVLAPDDRRERVGMVGLGGDVLGVSGSAW